MASGAPGRKAPCPRAPRSARCFAGSPAGEPLARLSERFPGASQRGYEWVADNRSTLSKLVPAAVKRRADGVVRDRS